MSSIRWDGAGKWIEPFVGSGAVVFNLQPRSALLTDSNKHIIALYHGIQAGRISASTTKEHLEGNKLLLEGEEHYYDIRDMFNATANPLDFLFLNRSCFNGMVRFKNGCSTSNSAESQIDLGKHNAPYIGRDTDYYNNW